MSLKRTRTEPTKPMTAPASVPAAEPPAPTTEVVIVEITAIARIEAPKTAEYLECARYTTNPIVAAYCKGCRRGGIPSHLPCGHEIVAGGEAVISAQLPLAQPHANILLDAARDIQCYELWALERKDVQNAIHHLAAALCVANPSAVVAASYYADKPIPVTSFSLETGYFQGADAAALQAWRDNILKHVQTKWWYMQEPPETTCTHGSECSHTDLDLVEHWMMHMRTSLLYYCEPCTPCFKVAARVVTHDPVAPTASQLAAIFATPA